jgi:hypothetical protein
MNEHTPLNGYNALVFGTAIPLLGLMAVVLFLDQVKLIFRRIAAGLGIMLVSLFAFAAIAVTLYELLTNFPIAKVVIFSGLLSLVLAATAFLPQRVANKN